MKKVLSIVLCTVMLLSLFVLPTSAAAWNGTDVSTSLKGEGTAEKPYLVETAADLAFLAQDVNGGNNYAGKYITQTADIDLGGKEWTPIGTKDNAFRGIYNGKGYDVTGLYYTVTTAYGGLFGGVKSTADTQAAILNLNVEGKVDTWTFTTKSATHIGGIIGYSEGTAATHVVVANCVSDVDFSVEIPEIADGQLIYAAGIAGYSNNIKVVNCINNGDITIVSNGRHLLVGGLLGNAYNNINLENVANYGNISVTVKSAHLAVAGGMIARGNGAVAAVDSVKNSVNYGTVSATSASNAFASGVMAQAFNANMRSFTIDNCANVAAIVAKCTGETNFGYAGGMLGYDNVGYITIKNCANKGEVSIESIQTNRNPAGIVGVSNCGEAPAISKIENCISTMKATGYIKNSVVENCTSEAEPAAVDAAVKLIEATMEDTIGVTVNGVEYKFEAPAPVLPDTPIDPDLPVNPNPGTGDATVLFVIVAVIALAGVVVTKKVSVR